MVRIAAEVGLPLISGGEVRRDRLSRVLFLPQYREALATRYIEFISQAVRTYPEMPGRESWTDRVCYDHERDGLQSMSSLWPGGAPMPVQGFVSALGLLATRRATLRMAFGLQGEIGA